MRCVNFAAVCAVAGCVATAAAQSDLPADKLMVGVADPSRPSVVETLHGVWQVSVSTRKDGSQYVLLELAAFEDKDGAVQSFYGGEYTAPVLIFTDGQNIETTSAPQGNVDGEGARSMASVRLSCSTGTITYTTQSGLTCVISIYSCYDIQLIPRKRVICQATMTCSDPSQNNSWNCLGEWPQIPRIDDLVPGNPAVVTTQ